MATKKYHKKPATKAPTPEPKTAASVSDTPRPHPMALPDTLFDCGMPRRDLTDLQLLVAMFDAPNAPGFKNPASGFLAGVLLSNTDEMDAATAMNNGLDNSEVIGRINMRAGYRAAIAVELARRVDGGAS